MLIGPDVSSYQGLPNWNAVAASGRSFAWTKATQGLDYINPTFGYNWAGIRNAGIVRGAYHFFDATVDATAQAKAFLSAIDSAGGLFPLDLLALDAEDPTSGTAPEKAPVLDFLRYVAGEVGFNPELYSGRWWLDPHGVEGDDELATYPLWLSGYSTNPPALPPGWKILSMWQDTDNARIPGIDGPVDESIFFGTLEQLNSLGMPAPDQPAQPAPPTVDDQVITIASVIGDMTYPDDAQWDALAPNQPVSRRIFQRQLVQHVKLLKGAA